MPLRKTYSTPVFFWVKENRLEVIGAESRYSMRDACKGLFPGNHAEFRVFGNGSFPLPQTGVANVQFSVLELIGERYFRVTNSAARCLPVGCIQAVGSGTRRTGQQNGAANPQSEAVLSGSITEHAPGQAVVFGGVLRSASNRGKGMPKSANVVIGLPLFLQTNLSKSNSCPLSPVQRCLPELSFDIVAKDISSERRRRAKRVGSSGRNGTRERS